VEGKPAWQQPPVEGAEKAGDVDNESKEVTFQSYPSGAQVQINGTIACTTPCSVFMPNYYFEMKGKDSGSSKHRETPMIARFSKDGYLSENVQMTAGPFRSEIPGSTPNYDYYVIVRTNVSAQLQAAPTPIPERKRSTVEPPASVAPASADLGKELTPQQWFERGLARFDKGDPNGAIRDYNEAILRKPDYAAAFNERGNALYNKGDLDGALKDYGEAIRLKPDYAAALYNRGNVRRAKDDLDSSLKDYDESIRLNPSSADAFNNRGLARHNKGDFDGALKDYSDAIRLRPDMVEAFNNRAIVLRAKGDLDGAIRDYDEAIRLKPDMAEAFNNRAVVRQDKGDVDGGLEDCNQAIRLRPSYAAAFYNRANLRRAKGDLDGAQRDYNEALRLGFKPIHEEPK
jgi:lipoprotein NlpI